MGTYTGVRFHAPLNPQGLLAVSLRIKMGWEGVAASLPGIVWGVFPEMSRARLIPEGACQDMPADWPDWQNHLDGRTWKVACSLKDPDTLRRFLEEILPQLVSEPVAVQCYCEEWPLREGDGRRPEERTRTDLVQPGVKTQLSW